MKYITQFDNDAHHLFDNEFNEQKYTIVVNNQGQWTVQTEGEWGLIKVFDKSFTTPVEGANAVLERLSSKDNTITWKYTFDEQCKQGVLIVRMFNV